MIVPVYGAEKYLRQCVESVLAQTYSHWELILVDDGSKDTCPAICDEYSRSDSRIRVIHQENGGFSVARNSGIDASKGEYLTFVDADDIIHPGFLEFSLRMVKAQGCDIACVEMRRFRDIPRIDDEEVTFPTMSLAGWEYLEKALYQTSGNNGVWGRLYRRSVFKREKFTPGIGYEDLDIFYRIFANVPKIAYTSVEMYYYRQNPDSYMNNFRLSRSDSLDVCDRMVEYLGKVSPDLEKAARDRRLSAYFNIFCLMIANNYNDYALEKRCWDVIKVERMASLLNPKVRLKNKLGVVVSFFGRPALRLLARMLY